MILLNHVIQVFAGPDEHLSGQDAFGLQFGDGLMRRLTAVERDFLRDIMIADRLLEEAYGGRLIPVPSVPISLETLSSNSLMSRAKEILNVSRLIIIKARESIAPKG
jgi:hypothetical protein